MHNGVDLAKAYGASSMRRTRVTHSNGIKTVYDHVGSAGLSWVGKYVYRDTPIGRINATGNRTGPHLHFAVVVGGVARNPLYYVSL